MRAMNDHDCETKDRLHSEITHLKSELEKCRVELERSNYLQKIAEEDSKKSMECAGKAIEDLENTQAALHTSEQRVKELQGVIKVCEDALEWCVDTHGNHATIHMTVSRDALATLHKAIGEVK